MATYNSSNRSLGILVGIIILAIVGFLAYPYVMHDNRTTGERLGDAVDALPHGIDKAADQLGDRSPAERAGDALRKTGDKIDNAVR